MTVDPLAESGSSQETNSQFQTGSFGPLHGNGAAPAGATSARSPLMTPPIVLFRTLSDYEHRQRFRCRFTTRPDGSPILWEYMNGDLVTNHGDLSFPPKETWRRYYAAGDVLGPLEYSRGWMESNQVWHDVVVDDGTTGDHWLWLMVRLALKMSDSFYIGYHINSLQTWSHYNGCAYVTRVLFTKYRDDTFEAHLIPGEIRRLLRDQISGLFEHKWAIDLSNLYRMYFDMLQFVATLGIGAGASLGGALMRRSVRAGASGAVEFAGRRLRQRLLREALQDSAEIVGKASFEAIKACAQRYIEIQHERRNREAEQQSHGEEDLWDDIARRGAARFATALFAEILGRQLNQAFESNPVTKRMKDDLAQEIRERVLAAVLSVAQTMPASVMDEIAGGHAGRTRPFANLLKQSAVSALQSMLR